MSVGKLNRNEVRKKKQLILSLDEMEILSALFNNSVGSNNDCSLFKVRLWRTTSRFGKIEVRFWGANFTKNTYVFRSMYLARFGV